MFCVFSVCTVDVIPLSVYNEYSVIKADEMEMRSAVFGVMAETKRRRTVCRNIK